MTAIARYRTAMARGTLSKPVALALYDGLLPTGVSFFDYGCGRGGDVRRLASLGYDAAGWDPTHAPTIPKRAADVVNLGYVINVIEDPEERVETLREAWTLARHVLVIAARPDWEARTVQGKQFGDGILTSKDTFQKFFSQEELRAWIDEILGVRCVAAAPGIFYVFREDSGAHGFLAARVRRRPGTTPRPQVHEAVDVAYLALLQPVVAFIHERGRLPAEWEVLDPKALRATFGSLKTALAAARRVCGDKAWAEAIQAAERDLSVYLALSVFGGRSKFSALPMDVQLDVKSLFGSYKAACEIADRLLFRVGNQSAINAACAQSQFGKLTPEALYVHTSAISSLDPLLRIYEGCGRALVGAVEDVTLVKLNRIEAKVSYLAYPTFDRDPHPALSMSLRADLSRLHVKHRDYAASENPPILHRKETFVPEGYPGREKFARLTAQEERAGLFTETATIGTRAGWQKRLNSTGVRLVGHRLVRKLT